MKANWAGEIVHQLSTLAALPGSIPRTDVAAITICNSGLRGSGTRHPHGA